MDTSRFAPICLFVYNRIDVTEKTVEALQKNLNAKETDVFVFSDGPKSENDLENVKKVRNYINGIDNSLFKSISIFENQENLGLAHSIIHGVSLVLEKCTRTIVLEDDIVTSPYFLTYMNTALDLYEADENVASIHAWTLPLKGNEIQTYFLKGADCWGWATWRRAWQHFERDGKKLLNELENKHLTEKFDLENSYPYTQMLRDQIHGKNNSWAIRWHASAFLKGMLTLYPNKSLVQNIGFNNPLATHTSAQDTLKFYSRKIDFEQFFPVSKIPLCEDEKIRHEIVSLLKKQNSFFSKVKRKIFN